MENYETIEKELQHAKLAEVVRCTRHNLEEAIRACREMPEVTAWEASFLQTRFRYNYLVLDGPSKMGLTLFCRSRSLGRREMLKLDCAGADTQDLTKF